MLTLEQLKEMEPGTIIATGLASDTPQELFLANTGRLLRWVAVRGGYHDWTIYAHFSDRGVEWIKRHGNKVFGKDHIKRLVPCTDEAFAFYRY